MKDMKDWTRIPFLPFLLFLAIAGCSQKSEKEAAALKPLVEQVRRVDLKDVISNTGVLEATIKVDLKSEASGRVDTLYVDEGTRLRKGQKILRINPERLLTQREKLNLRAQKAQLQFEAAKRDFDNASQLAEFGKIAANQVADLKNQFELGRISLDELRLELRDVEKELDNTLIRSPMDGVLVSLNVEEGEIVVSATGSNSGGTAIGSIADVSKLEVVTEIGEVDYPKVRIGMPAEVSMAADPGRITHGRVSFVSLAAKKQDNSQVSNFRIRIAIDSLLQGMVPGINVNVDLVLMEKMGVLGVPFTMVQQGRRKNAEAAIVMMADNRKPRTIKIGETDYKYYEVLDGLKEGDRVMKMPAKDRERGNNRGGGGGGFRH